MTWEGIPSYEEMALELARLNTALNGGRGISALRSIITYLEMNDGEGARQVARTDFDKLSAYPAAIAALARLGLSPEPVMLTLLPGEVIAAVKACIEDHVFVSPLVSRAISEYVEAHWRDFLPKRS